MDKGNMTTMLDFDPRPAWLVITHGRCSWTMQERPCKRGSHREVVVVSKTGERKKFDSALKASLYLGCHKNTVSRAIRNNHKVKGYTPMYV
jgi:hypothetical protein